MSTERYLFPAHGPNEGAIRQALTLAVQIQQQAGENTDIVVLTHDKGSLTPSTVNWNGLGDAVSKALSKGQTIPLPGGGHIRHETMRSYRSTSFRGIVLALHPEKKMLNAVDAARLAQAVIVVPWLRDDVAEWVSTWQPAIPGQPTPTAPPHVQNSVVSVALEHLTGSINLSTGLGHPLDHASAVHLFRLLKKHGEDFDPAEVRAWAVTHSWHPNAADDLEDVAAKVLAGKRLKVAREASYGTDYIEMLRKEAKERSTEPK